MNKNLRISAAALACIAVLAATANDVKVVSPDRHLEAVISDQGGLTLSISLDGTVLMQSSQIGITTGDGKNVGGAKTKISKTPKTAYREEQRLAPFYRQEYLTTKYHQCDIRLNDGFGIQMRVYDDAVAYRFYTTRKGETKIKNEKAEYKFGKDRKAWLSYTTNDKKPYAMAFQNIYDVTTIDTAENKIAFLPATIDCGKAKVTVLESNVKSYPCMFVKAGGDCLKAEFAPYPKKMAYYPWRHMSYVEEGDDFIAVSTGARQYPWRAFAVTTSDTQMPVHDIVYALADDNCLGDVSWVKPGKVAWDWWNDWNLKGVDFKAGINYDTYKYYIDFASEYGIEYVVLDEGWYDSAKGDILNPIPEIKFEQLLAHAKSKGVSIVLWAVFNVMDENLETICKKYADMGVAGFKVDFMDRNDQTAVEMVERLARCCAKHKLLLDLHGIYTPVGLNRTYPNVLNYESVFGMEEARWTTPDHDMPLYDVTFPYIRMMAGQVDFTPGAMRNGTKSDWKAIYTKPVSMGTRCHQLACYIVHDSPFTMLADTPTNYEPEPDYTRFVTSLPTVFDQTIIPQGEIGKYIVSARRKGDAWYVAGQTNWDGRDITLSFDFLPEGKTYKASIVTDGVNADHDAEDHKMENQTVSKTTKMNIRMAGGGGFAIRLLP